MPRMFDIDDEHCQWNYDLLITCVDVAQLPADLAKSASRYSSCLWLDTGNGESIGQVKLGRLGHANENSVKLPSVFDFYLELVQNTLCVI